MAVIQNDAVGVNAEDWRFPKQMHAAGPGFFDQQFVQDGSPNAKAQAVRIIGADLSIALKETDALEAITGAFWNLHIEFGEERLRFGKKPFAAGLIDGVVRAIGDGHGEALAPGSNGSNQSGGATANYENVDAPVHS